MITGTSNGTGVSFALPVAPNSTIYSADMPIVLPVAVVNNGTAAVGRLVLTGGSTAANVDRDITGNNWTNTGTKTIRIHIRYFK